MALEITRVEELAALCISGKTREAADAGIDLVQRLWAHEVEPTIDGLVTLACPTRKITCEAFDRLADALAAAISLREMED